MTRRLSGPNTFQNGVHSFIIAWLFYCIIFIWSSYTCPPPDILSISSSRTDNMQHWRDRLGYVSRFVKTRCSWRQSSKHFVIPLCMFHVFTVLLLWLPAMYSSCCFNCTSTKMATSQDIFCCVNISKRNFLSFSFRSSRARLIIIFLALLLPLTPGMFFQHFKTRGYKCLDNLHFNKNTSSVG